MPKNLAYDMRPRTIDEVVGQEHLTEGKGIIKRMVDAKRLQSIILYGPPGTGKTSIASALSGSTGIPFRQFNAGVDSKKELQAFAKELKDTDDQLIILLDEIHRLDKPKQDYLLPFMESGQFIVIGATTENPYISIQPAIRSRTSIFEVFPLSPQDLEKVVIQALNDNERGLGKLNATLTEDAMYTLIHSTNGDVRSALNALELTVRSSDQKNPTVEKEDIESVVQMKNIAGDKDGDSHYDLISAFQKSLRGSDTDAGLYYLARLLETGDLEIVIRRLIVIAYEDVGLGDPQVPIFVSHATQDALRVGLPEARIPLSMAVILITTAPKSNKAYSGLDRAREMLNVPVEIPKHLRDAHYKGAGKLGHGVDYIYTQDEKFGWARQQYLPDKLIGQRFLDTSRKSESAPAERKVLDRVDQLWKAQHNQK